MYDSLAKYFCLSVSFHLLFNLDYEAIKTKVLFFYIGKK